MQKEVLYDIYIYIYKSNDALEQGCDLEILEGVPVVSAHHFHHGLPIPIAGQETSDLGDHPLPFQYL